jgi:hypothetical protein
MLTAFQCETVAYIANDCEIVCPDCAELVRGDGPTKPIIRYELDSEQGERWAGESPEDIWGEDEAAEHSEECVPGIYCESCGNELVEEYHYGHAEESETA